MSLYSVMLVDDEEEVIQISKNNSNTQKHR